MVKMKIVSGGEEEDDDDGVCGVFFVRERQTLSRFSFFLLVCFFAAFVAFFGLFTC